MKHLHDIIIIGICRRAYSNFPQDVINIDGFSGSLYSFLFPAKLNSHYLVLSISTSDIFENKDIYVLDSNNDELGALHMKLEVISSGIERDTIPLIPESSRTIIFTQIQNSDIIIKEPGIYKFVDRSGGEEVLIGEINAVLVPAPILDDALKSAIRSDVHASKAIRLQMTCKSCNSTYGGYIGLERKPDMEQQGWHWHEDISGEWTCECGQTRFNLEYMSNGLRGMLGRSARTMEAAADPLYERGSLLEIRKRFQHLLDYATKEEELQVFISEHLILLSFFRARQIFIKPQIGIKYRADFGILTYSGELILVEIEKQSTRLLKKDGHRASELTHALDQVGDWLNELSDHKVAILDGLGVDPKIVNKISGAVIAGRDHGNDAAHLRRLRMRPNDNCVFMTYDDLLGALDSLIHEMETV